MDQDQRKIRRKLRMLENARKTGNIIKLPDREIFYTPKEARIAIEQRRQQFNTVRLHATLGCRPQAPGANTPAWKPVSQPQVAM